MKVCGAGGVEVDFSLKPEPELLGFDKERRYENSELNTKYFFSLGHVTFKSGLYTSSILCLKYCITSLMCSLVYSSFDSI